MQRMNIVITNVSAFYLLIRHFVFLVLCQFTSGWIISSFNVNILTNCMIALVNHVIILVQTVRSMLLAFLR